LQRSPHRRRLDRFVDHVLGPRRVERHETALQFAPQFAGEVVV